MSPPDITPDRLRLNDEICAETRTFWGAKKWIHKHGTKWLEEHWSKAGEHIK